jgi:hypothetical protein
MAVERVGCSVWRYSSISMLLVIGKAPSLRTQHTPLERQAPLRTLQDPCVHYTLWCACGQASTVRNAGEEDEDHRDAHGEEGDEEHVGGAAVVVHACIITQARRDARKNLKNFSR